MALEVKVAALLLPPALLWGTTEDGVVPPAARDNVMPSVTLRAKSDEHGVISVFAGGKPLNGEDLRSTAGANPHPEVVVAVDPGNQELSVANHVAQSVVTFEESAGLQTRIPPHSQARFRTDQGLQTVWITTGADNAGPLICRFPDGGQAEVSGQSVNRFDLFRDQSYTFCSNGRGEVANADGLVQGISSRKPAFHGGPLVRIPTGTGPARFERLTPMVETSVAGRPEQGLEIEAGRQRLLLSPDARATMRLANGTQAEFYADSAAHSLDWTVRKGELLFRIEGVPGIKVSGLTGQTASMQWDRNGLALRIKNLSSRDNLVVSLSERSVVAVSPQQVCSFPTVGQQAAGTPEDEAPGAESSRLAVFFELPGVADNLSRTATFAGQASSRHAATPASQGTFAGQEDGYANGDAPAQRGALLTPENRPDAVYATSAYLLRPQRGRLMAPRIFQPPATGF